MALYKGKTLEEALEVASIEENVDVKYINYFIEKEEEGDVVILTYFYSDIIAYASQYVRSILEAMKVKSEIRASFDNAVIKLKLVVDETSLLIGKDGKTLHALTTLTRAAVAKEFKRHFHLLIDINNYKEKKYDRILRIAKSLAREVQTTHQDLSLEPMTSDERRLIHNELANFPRITTQSAGEGNNRHIVIRYCPDEAVPADNDEKEPTENE